jgi:hypothetical protein
MSRKQRIPLRENNPGRVAHPHGPMMHAERQLEAGSQLYSKHTTDTWLHSPGNDEQALFFLQYSDGKGSRVP